MFGIWKINYRKFLMNEYKHWKVKSTKPEFRGNWLDLNLDNIELPDGKQIEFEALHYHRPGTGVIAEDSEGKLVLVKNYRYINDYYSWEAPAGTVPPEQTHKECIIEELKEEAGCTVDEKDLDYLGEYFPSIGSSDQIFYCYHARNVRKISDDIDTNEILEVKWFTKSEVYEMIKSGEIKDGFTISLIFKAILKNK